MVDKITRQIQEEIAGRVIGVLAPAAAGIIVVTSIAIFWFQPDQPTRIIPSGVAVLLLLVDCWLIRRKRMLAAANLFIVLMCATVLTAMTINGGVYAPAYMTVLGIVAFIAWFSGPRVAILFWFGSTAVGGMYVWMQSMGWLREMDKASPLLMWTLISCYQLAILIATVIPTRMLYKALGDSHRRCRDAEEAQEKECLAARDLALREKQLRQSEERLRYLANNIPSAVLYEITRYPDGSQQFTHIGENIEKIFNVSAEQVLGDSQLLYSMIHPDYLEGLKEAEQKSLVEMSLFQHELKFQVSGDKTIWCRISSTPSKHEDGSITWNGLLLDITSQKKAEQELRLFRLAVEASTDAIGMSTAEGIHWYQNDSFNTLFGDYARVSSHPISTLYDDPAVGRDIFDTIQAGKPWTGEVKMKSTDDHVLDIFVRAYAVMDETGRIAGLVGLHTDISGLKMVEQELASTRGMLETAIAQSPAGILIADAPDVTIRMANPAALGIRGDTQCLLTNIEWEKHSLHWNTFRPDGSEYPPDQLPLSRAVLEGEVTRNEEIIIVDEAGEKHWVSANAAPIRDSSGNIAAGIVVFTDITEQKKAEAEKENLEVQLRQSQKLEAIGQLAGGIAHDFNNILTAILGNLELSINPIRDKMGNNRNVMISMEEIERSAKKASTLTRQLLAFSRKEVHQPVILNLNQILTDLNSMLRRLITAKIDLQTLTQKNLKTICADAGQIEQIIMNMVVNSADAMPKGGQITLSTSNVILDSEDASRRSDITPGEYVVLTVSDTGHGMEASVQEHIFEPFFTTKPREKGTGLGLAMVYGIVKQSGGHIEIDSEPEKGTTFKLYFPVVKGEASSIKTDKVQEASLNGTETILLCEDNDSVRNLTAMLLTTAGYSVLKASKGSEAIQVAKEQLLNIDLLLTDVILPDTDGLELSKTLQAMLPDLPTLFISGYTSDVITTQGILPEGMEFLEKPFTQAALLSRIRGIIEKDKPSSGQ